MEILEDKDLSLILRPAGRVLARSTYQGLGPPMQGLDHNPEIRSRTLN